MTLNEFQKSAEELGLVCFSRECWEQLKETMCDKYCFVPKLTTGGEMEDICARCPFDGMEDKT